MVSLLAMTLCVAVQAKDYKYESVPGDLMKTRIYTLDNGLKVYLSVNNEKPRIQTYIAVRTGSRNDPPETTGLAHYLEHLMFKGTKLFGSSDVAKEAPLLDSIRSRFEVYRHITDPARRKQMYHQIDSISQLAAKYNIPNEYDKLMASIGADGSNAYTSNDVTCYTEDIPANEVDNWAKIQADRFQHMVIRGFHTELEAVYEEYNIGLARDFNKLYTALFAKLFPGHPYGTQTTIGTQEHLKNPSIVNIENYFKRYYVPNNVAICMAGDFDPDKVMPIIDKYFGSWSPNPHLSRPEYAPLKPLVHPVDTTVVGQEAENVVVAWRFDKASSPQADTLQVVTEMLKNGQAGLFDIDINQQMKCLGTEAFCIQLTDYSSLITLGMPKGGQSLDEVKDLIFQEVDKLKAGDFDDELLPSVVNNMKLNFYKSMEDNESRADKFVNAFINGQKWGDVVGQLDRISKMTKAQIVDFARRHLLDNYVVGYKRTGIDSAQKKIDKPQITAIPTNRDKQSRFVTDVINSKVEPIQPRFVDFKKDLAHVTTKKELPILYVQNKENGRFTLAYHYDFGSEADKWLPFALEYADYLGTDHLSAARLKQKFYRLACEFSTSVSGQDVYITLTGLNDNLKPALALLEDFMTNAKPDKEAYDKYVSLVLKARADSKKDQNQNFRALCAYGTYGEYNPVRAALDSAALVSKNPQELTNLFHSLPKYEHTVLYYGPTAEKDLAAILSSTHKVNKKLLPVPVGKEYTEQVVDKNEILIAPYQAKNIYYRQYTNSGRVWSPDQQPIVELFNEYFGGGMNTVVFQELRESRALAYSAWAYYATPVRKNHPEYALANVISQNDKMMDCIRTFGNIIDTIPQSEKSFDLARQALSKRLASARTTKFGIINAYLNARRLGLDYDINEKTYKALPSLTLGDVVKFETETMAHKPYRYMILGDEAQIDIKALEQIAPVKRVSTKDIFGY